MNHIPAEPKHEGFYLIEYCTDRYVLEKNIKSAEIAGWPSDHCWSINSGSCPTTWGQLLDDFRDGWEEFSNWTMLYVASPSTVAKWPMAILEDSLFKGFHILDCREELIGISAGSVTVMFEEDKSTKESLAEVGWEVHVINEDQDYWWLKEIV